MTDHPPQICVLGAGVVGLSTAICLQEEFPKLDISLIANKFNEDTLSTGAGGIFRPDMSIVPTEDLGWKWYSDSFKYYTEQVNLVSSCDAGFQRVSGSHISSIGKECVENIFMKEMAPDYRELTEEELEYFSPEFKAGVSYTTIVIDCKNYLPWMKKRFEDQGGRVHTRTLKSLKEAASWCDILVNCAGFEAGKLASDPKVIPIRGQTIKVQAPWIKHFYYANENYIIPGINTVTLGGIKQYGNRNPNVDSFDRDFIWHNCTKLVPSLQQCKIINEWVGLRPFRQPVRVESEILNNGNKMLKVVHNYGHGGSGVTLSRGTAMHATSLVKEFLRGVPVSRL